jgi:hypothetical protein
VDDDSDLRTGLAMPQSEPTQVAARRSAANLTHSHSEVFTLSKPNKFAECGYFFQLFTDDSDEEIDSDSEEESSKEEKAPPQKEKKNSQKKRKKSKGKGKG